MIEKRGRAKRFVTFSIKKKPNESYHFFLQTTKVLPFYIVVLTNTSIERTLHRQYHHQDREIHPKKRKKHEITKSV